MALVRAIVSLERTTLLPKDRCVNTFHFTTALPAVSSTEKIDILDAVTEFYNLPVPNGNQPSTFLSDTLKSGLFHTAKLYNLDDPEPRPPIAERLFSLAFPATQSLPGEVALVLSMKGEPVAGGTPARRRGRLYMGPLGGNAVTLDSEGDARPATNCMSTFLQAGQRLRDDASTNWVIYSRRGFNTVVITDLWIDNAFDTQRRRGASATSRLVG